MFVSFRFEETLLGI